MTPSFRLFTLLPAILIASFAPSLAATDNDLARAYRVIASKRFVDLTHSFDPRSPVWSGFGQAKMTPAADPKTQRPYTIQEDGIRTTLYEFVGQYGTHVDPPAHFDENGITMDAIPLKQMIAVGRAGCNALSAEGSEPRVFCRRFACLGAKARAHSAWIIRGTAN